MKKYYYDLHIHSCLSPCGNDDSTPDSIAGMGELNGLDIMALTDHNTCKNCPAFFEAAKRHNILAVAGMELTTSEDIHMVCLFPDLKSAMAFGEEIEKRIFKVPNRIDIFGNQLICDSEDNVIGNEDYLLSNATNVSLEEAPNLVEKFGGICYPAHIDRESNGVIAILGVFPKEEGFCCAEVHNSDKLNDFAEKSGLAVNKLVVSSDAHNLWDIKEQQEFFYMNEIPEGCDNAGEYVISFLKEQL
ncbi:MAG: PHP domain-containing protein [Clostridia bacterium]|nr:PHP domain-containing protein [Clostridia bacterium]